jgi:hypothetical protein
VPERNPMHDTVARRGISILPASAAPAWSGFRGIAGVRRGGVAGIGGEARWRRGGVAGVDGDARWRRGGVARVPLEVTREAGVLAGFGKILTSCASGAAGFFAIASTGASRVTRPLVLAGRWSHARPGRPARAIGAARACGAGLRSCCRAGPPLLRAAGISPEQVALLRPGCGNIAGAGRAVATGCQQWANPGRVDGTGSWSGANPGRVDETTWRGGLWLADDIAVRIHAARRVFIHRVALVAGRIHTAQGVVEH